MFSFPDTHISKCVGPDSRPQGHVIFSHITLKFHYFSKIMKFSRYDATMQRNL